jgi:branched-chain amino acid transport system permease protein
VRTRTRLTAGLVVAAALCAIVLALAPYYLGLYWLRILTNVCMFALITQSINVIAGFTGYPAFGNVVFFGLGAYGMAVSTVQFHYSSGIGLLVGLLLCSIVVVIVGPLLLRLRGHYFAIATLGLNEAIKAVVANLNELTGGGQGISLNLPTGTVEESARQFYWLFFALAVVGIGITAAFQFSRFGYACRAIRANEDGAESLGINTTFYKTAAWLISALLAGCAGGLYALWIGFIEPSDVFDITISVKGFVMFLLGGPGSIFGPVIGAVLVELATTLTWSYLLKYHLAVLGIIIMTAAVLIPRRIPQRLTAHLLRVTALQHAKK